MISFWKDDKEHLSVVLILSSIGFPTQQITVVAINAEINTAVKVSLL